jgi:hypothetical protein
MDMTSSIKCMSSKAMERKTMGHTCWSYKLTDASFPFQDPLCQLGIVPQCSCHIFCFILLFVDVPPCILACVFHDFPHSMPSIITCSSPSYVCSSNISNIPLSFSLFAPVIHSGSLPPYYLPILDSFVHSPSVFINLHC